MNAVFSSLAAFLAAGVRPPTPLAKAITLVLVIKLVAIALAAVFLRSGDWRPVVDRDTLSRMMGPASPPATTNGER